MAVRFWNFLRQRPQWHGVAQESLGRAETSQLMISIGINYSQMHDSSACIVRDGEVLFAVAEERLSRVKHDARFPELAIRACLDFVSVRPDQLDFVCFGWPPVGVSVRHDLKGMIKGEFPIDYTSVASLFRRYVSLTRQHDGENPFRARFGDNESTFSIYSSSPGTCHKCLRVLRIRRCCGTRPRWPRRVGSNLALAWTGWKAGACLDDSLAQLTRTLLRSVHSVSRIPAI